MIINSYYEQSYTSRVYNLKEMDMFRDTKNLPRLNQEEIENVIRSITRIEIESPIKIFPTKSPGPYNFTGTSIKHLNKN